MTSNAHGGLGSLTPWEQGQPKASDQERQSCTPRGAERTVRRPSWRGHDTRTEARETEDPVEKGQQEPGLLCTRDPKTEEKQEGQLTEANSSNSGHQRQKLLVPPEVPS